MDAASLATTITSIVASVVGAICLACIRSWQQTRAERREHAARTTAAAAVRAAAGQAASEVSTTRHSEAMNLSHHPAFANATQLLNTPTRHRSFLQRLCRAYKKALQRMASLRLDRMTQDGLASALVEINADLIAEVHRAVAAGGHNMAAAALPARVHVCSVVQNQTCYEVSRSSIYTSHAARVHACMDTLNACLMSLVQCISSAPTADLDLGVRSSSSGISGSDCSEFRRSHSMSPQQRSLPLQPRQSRSAPADIDVVIARQVARRGSVVGAGAGTAAVGIQSNQPGHAKAE